MNGGFYIISIHTPTQGVTEYNPVENYDRQISIHTPTQGVTLDERYNYLMGVIS